MHPVIMRQLAADHIAEMHAKAEDERLAHAAPVHRRGRTARPKQIEHELYRVGKAVSS
jgi:hypothetical protein